MKTLEDCLLDISDLYPKEFIDLLRFVFPAETVFESHQDGDYNAVLTENDSRDPGSTTRFGIDAASHPHLDIANLTFADAAHEYYLDTWKPLRCPEIVSEQVQISLCDAAINCGLVRAVKWLQASAQAQVDGNFGTLTLHAVNMADGDVIAKGLNDARQHYYLFEVRPSLRAIYGKGWINRLTALRQYIADKP